MNLIFTITCPHCYNPTSISSILFMDNKNKIIDVETLQYTLPDTYVCNSCGEDFNVDIEVNVEEDNNE